jgi:MinD superfamily P-loop ATPase
MVVTDLPVLNEALCTGCGDCVMVCPTGCLALDGPAPWMPRPLACISCAACVLVCPTRALALADAGQA